MLAGGTQAYRDIRDKAIPIINQKVEDAISPRVFVSFHEIRRKTGIGKYKLHSFLKELKRDGVDVHRSYIVITDNEAWRSASGSLYNVNPSISLL
jgi:tRNA G26 N,N-dimethylase Trm1